jgi:hypothetical protein
LAPARGFNLFSTSPSNRVGDMSAEMDAVLDAPFAAPDDDARRRGGDR